MKDISKVMLQTENSILMRNTFERNFEKEAAYIEEWWHTHPQHFNQRVGISIVDPVRFFYCVSRSTNSWEVACNFRSEMDK